MPAAEPGWRAGGGTQGAAPNWNLAPSQDAWVVVADGDGCVPIRMSWGFRPAWAKDGAPAPINARAETAAGKPYFRDAWRKSRCAVPADGWYEWRREGKEKIPFLIAAAGGGVLLLAGLHTAGGFAVVTVSANERVSGIHHRMPLALSPEGTGAWLDGATGAEALGGIAGRPPGIELSFHEVSREVNSARNNHVGLVSPVAGVG